MTKQTRNQNSIKYGTIEMILLLLLQSGRKYGYELAQELTRLSDGEYELKETTMYPTLYRMNENHFIESEKVKVGARRFRVYYSITNAGRSRLNQLLNEFNSTIASINKIISRTVTSNADTDQSEELS